jgi:Holliday junction resolvase-like predicted endonuclease
MPDSQPFLTKPTSWHVSVAAEAIAAAQFARCGFDVSVQYGANQPEYDLIVARGDHLLKVSVKGSQDGGWGLTQSYMADATKKSGKTADYHGAIDLWLARHGLRTVFCFVQFHGVRLDQMPRIYLASAAEVAQQLRQAKDGQGDSILNENWTFTRGRCAGITDKLPQNWVFSEQRVVELLTDRETGLAVKPGG